MTFVFGGTLNLAQLQQLQPTVVIVIVQYLHVCRYQGTVVACTGTLSV